MKKTKLSLMATSLLLTFVTTSSAIADKVRLLESNTDAILARRDLMASAKKEILAEYFAAGRDQMTAAAMALLIAKAREGVKVKLIIDAYANELPMAVVQDIMRASEKKLSVDDQTLVEQNMEVKLYNQQTSLPSLHAMMHRDHAKLLVVDGQTVIMGGRNGTSEYFGLNPGHNFIDMDVILSGKTVSEIRTNYLTLWNSKLVAAPVGGESTSNEDKVSLFCKPRPGMYKTLTESDQAWLDCMNRMIRLVRDGKENFFEIAKGDFSTADEKVQDWMASAVEIEDVYFSSHKADQFNSKLDTVSTLTDEYLEELGSAQTEIRITTPYLLATPKLFEVFKAARERNVRIQVVTNSATSTDSDLFYAGYRTHIQKIINLGVEVYELRGTDTLHAKTALIDNKTVIIGSYNLDPRSAYINREVALFVHDTENKGIAAGLASFMDKMKAMADVTANEDESEKRTGPIQYLYIKSLILIDPLLKKVL